MGGGRVFRKSTVIAFIAVAVLGLGSVLSDRNSFLRDAPTLQGAPAIKSVLFIGNSFVSANNGVHNHLRKLTQSIFVESSDAFLFISVTKGGAKLSDHVLGAEDKIKN